MNLDKSHILTQSEIKSNDYILNEFSHYDLENKDDEMIIQQISSEENIKINIPFDMVETDLSTKNENEISKHILIKDEEKKEKEVYKDSENNFTDDLKLYDKDEIITFVNGLDLSHVNGKPFPSFNKDEKIKRILVVTHSGFISEIINIIKSEENLKPEVKHNTRNTGLYVIRISCKICGINSTCKFNPQCNEAELEFDFIVTNDVGHLDVVKEQNKNFNTKFI